MLCLFSTDEPSKMENAKGIDELGTRFGGRNSDSAALEGRYIVIMEPEIWGWDGVASRRGISEVCCHAYMYCWTGRRCENARIHMTTDGRRGVWLGRGREMGAWARLRRDGTPEEEDIRTGLSVQGSTFRFRFAELACWQ